MSQSEQVVGIDLARQALSAARATARRQGATTTAKQRHRPKATSSVRDRREPTGLEWILLQVQAEYGWEAGRRGGEVLTSWASIVGPAVAAHLEAVAYDKDTRLLEIRPDSGAWFTQAGLIKTGLVKKINDALGPDSVRDISILSVGSRPYRTPVRTPEPPALRQQAPAEHPRPRIRVREDAPPGFHRALQVHQQVWAAHKAASAPSTGQPATHRSHTETDTSQ
ncbi:DUF721 domain-containing protein [Streptomyces erythrochromogenes]|uniref:DUF721 domain-containing protein n=1 Tax=Streptomyces erythrochromogenes TaxID=285574 RepID=UPI00343A2FBE